MIVKELEDRPTSKDPRIAAGHEAERQMAHYLDRAFRLHSGLFVLNNLRLINPAFAPTDEREDAGQIDHLVLHRWGAFIIESKSARGGVSIRDDGSGGDEWTRTYQGRTEGFASPLQQAIRQGTLLRTVLNGSRHLLLGKIAPVAAILTKVLYGTDQRNFRNFPIQIIVALSDRATIDRGPWKEPTQPFRTYVCKADQVTIKIENEYQKHVSASGLLAKENGEYGVWAMKVEELAKVTEFLVASHTPVAREEPRGGAPGLKYVPAPTAPAQPVRAAAGLSAVSCRACGGDRLNAASGKYGYYWKCAACEANTPMPVLCSKCGAKGQHGKLVRIRKSALEYFRDCESCGLNELIWRQGYS